MAFLRKLNPREDATALHKIFSSEASCKYLSRPHSDKLQDTINMLVEWTKGTENTSWAIISDNNDDCLGRISLIPTGDNAWEAAIGIIPNVGGKGLATKAMAEALDIIFTRHNARRIIADCDPDNTSSIALFERLGFQREGYLRETWNTHIGIRDTVLLALISSDPRPWHTDFVTTP